MDISSSLRSLTAAASAVVILSLPAGADNYTGKIHWEQVRGTVSKDLFSMNLFSFPISKKVSNATYRENVRYLKASILRLHNAGTTRDKGGASLIDPQAKDWDYEKIKAILNHLKDVPGDRMFNIVHFPSWLDTDDDKMLDPDKVDVFAKFCADLVRYTNKTLAGTYIKYWEVTNERDQIYGDAGKIHELADVCNKAFDAMKAVDPTIKVGAPAFVRPDIAKNVQGFVDGTYQKLDFISAHGYACGSSRTPDQEVYDKADRLVGHMKAVRDYCKTKAGKHIPIHWNEFNVSWTWRSWDGRMKNNKGACFDALCYIGAIQAGLDALYPWNECDGIYGKMGNDLKLRPPAHAINVLATYVGGYWVSTVDTPMVKMLGVVNGSEKVVVMVNRSNNENSMALTFTGWTSEPPASAPVDHYQIDSSGRSQSATTYAALKTGVSLPRHTVHVFVIKAGPVEKVSLDENPPRLDERDKKAAKLYFRSGFEADVILRDYHRFAGRDKVTGYGWDTFGDVIPGVKEFNFKYWGGKCPEDAYVDIIPDPDGQRGRILHAQVNSDSGGGVRCRTGGSMYFDKSFDQVCVRYKYRISDAYQAVVDNKIPGWWLISELWTEGAESDRASMPLYLHKGDGYFWFRQTLRAKQGGSFRTLWEVKNEAFRIPLGKWVEVVHLVKKGPPGVGRIYFEMDGQVVLDIRDKPIVWNDRRWKYWSCLKLYEGLEITDYLRERGTPAQVWYDDFEVWSDIPTSKARK